MPDKPFLGISFYVVAHADDWQLFMNPNVYNDLVAPHNKVIFIITTAGDAGAGASYWNAREEGCKSSIRFCLTPVVSLSESRGTREFNRHAITYWSANHATCYFFRLPDGNLDGSGFLNYGNQSLSKLREGNISSITSVDNSVIYTGWQDFYTTLQKIINFESNRIPGTWINYLNPDIGINTDDHKDHIATGQAIQEMTIISTLHQALFRGYSSINTHENLDQTELFWKIGMFAAYETAVYDGSGYSTIKENVSIYSEWCRRCPDFITIKP